MHITFKLYMALMIAITAFLALVVPWLFPLVLVISLFYGWIDSIRNNETSFLPTKVSKFYTFKIMKQDYLSSQTWDKKRKQALAAAHYTCESCGATGVSLECHHVAGYRLIPNEPISNLRALCRECHEAEHALHGFPQTLEDYYTWSHPITIRNNDE